MQGFVSGMQGVRGLLQDPDRGQESTAWEGSGEDDPDYVLLLQCNQLAVDIDNEIVNIHNYMKDKYKAKFPELASFVHDAVQYAKTLQIIRNEMDLTKVQMEDVLPQVCCPLFETLISKRSPSNKNGIHFAFKERTRHYRLADTVFGPVVWS